MEYHHGHERHGLSRETLLVLEFLDLLSQKLDQIMSTQADLVAAATTLSTASDAVSVKLDTLIQTVDAVVVALQGADLDPTATAALAAMKASAVTAAAAGDKVDAEVTKLDAVLPTPAPAAPVSPVSPVTPAVSTGKLPPR
jgi:hypothetical protein